MSDIRYYNLAMVRGETIICRACGARVPITHVSQTKTCLSAACRRARHRDYMRKVRAKKAKKKAINPDQTKKPETRNQKG